MDWEGLKRLAFGPLNLMPQQFWGLTLAEFNDLIEGYKWRNRREWEKFAQLAVWTSQKLRKNTTAKKLLGTDKSEKKKTTAEESRKNVIDLVERLGRGLSIKGVS
jgi:hypothetical protein